MRQSLLLATCCLAIPTHLGAQPSGRAPAVDAPRAISGSVGARSPLTPEQQRRRLDYLRERDIEHAKQRLRGGAVGTTILTSGDAQTNYVIIRRAVSSQVELHARGDDLVVVRSGRGALEFGERSEGSEMLAPGEWRGGRLVPTHRLVVGPGDVVRIPAAVPHRFEVSAAEPLEYLLVKQRHAQLPLTPKNVPRPPR